MVRVLDCEIDPRAQDTAVRDGNTAAVLVGAGARSTAMITSSLGLAIAEVYVHEPPSIAGW